MPLSTQSMIIYVQNKHKEVSYVMAAIPNYMGSNMPTSRAEIHNQDGYAFYVFSRIRNNGMGRKRREKNQPESGEEQFHASLFYDAR